MKIQLLPLLLSAVLFGCKKENAKTLRVSEAKENAAVVAAEMFAVDTAQSRVFWEGSEGLAMIRLTHTGYFKLRGGALSVQNGAPLGGKIDIDLASVIDTDIQKPNKKLDLENHLKSADFFEVEKFPVAAFEITGSEKMAGDSVRVTGNLNMKGVSKSVSFPAKLSIAGGVLNAGAKFLINRKDWGIHFMSENSFGDEMIRHEVGIQLQIVAHKTAK
jgi:polyisoprenoid-binding protein YceI